MGKCGRQPPYVYMYFACFNSSFSPCVLSLVLEQLALLQRISLRSLLLGILFQAVLHFSVPGRAFQFVWTVGTSGWTY